MTAPITVLYAAPLALLIIGMAARVARRRWVQRIGLGDGGDAGMTRLIRAHANLTEVAPIGILMLLLAELGGGPGWLLHASGAALLTGRVLHALGLSAHGGASFGRFAGSAFSWGAVIVLALANLWLVARSA